MEELEMAAKRKERQKFARKSPKIRNLGKKNGKTSQTKKLSQEGARTPGHKIKSLALYQLSYPGCWPAVLASCDSV